MTNIKVTVEYEKPEMSKFEALMAEYKAAKLVADSTETLLVPSKYLLEEDSLIPCWSVKCIINKLQDKLHQLIKDDIEKQNKRSKTIRNTLNGIQN